MSYRIVEPLQSQSVSWETGKNAAQILDTDLTDKSILQGREIAYRERALKQKEVEDARKLTTDFLNNQLGLGHPSDAAYFAEKTKLFRDNVVKAFKKGRNKLSIDDEANLNQQWGELIRIQKQSENRLLQDRKNIEEVDKGNYSPSEIKKVHEGFQRPSIDPITGKQDFTSISGVPRFDIEKNAVIPLQNSIHNQVEQNKRQGVAIFRPGDAYKVARTLGEKNAQVMKEMHAQLSDMPIEDVRNELRAVYLKDKDAFGNNNPSYGKMTELKIDNFTPQDIDKLTTKQMGDITGTQLLSRFIHDESPIPTSEQRNAATIKKPNVVYRHNIDPETGEVLKSGTSTYADASGKNLEIKNVTFTDPVTGIEHTGDVTDIQAIHNEKGDIVGGSTVRVSPSGSELKEYAAKKAEFVKNRDYYSNQIKIANKDLENSSKQNRPTIEAKIKDAELGLNKLKEPKIPEPETVNITGKRVQDFIGTHRIDVKNLEKTANVIHQNGESVSKSDKNKETIKGGLPLIDNKESFLKLPKGTKYTKIDGLTYIKQ